MNIQKKLTKSEVRVTRRKRDRHIRNKENTVLADIIARQILGDSNASISSYLKRRKQQHLETPTRYLNSTSYISFPIIMIILLQFKVKSHSPAERHLSWNVSSVMDMLRAWPTETKINWTAEARKLGIPGDNKGQVLKETATRNGIDTIALDSRSGSRIRARKRRLPVSDISVGCGPSKKAVKSAWAEMIQSGWL